MSVIDAEVSVQDVSLATPSAEAMEGGVPPHVELGIIPGLTLPFANPATGDPLIVPVGKLKFTFSRQQAIDIFTAGLKAAESLPEGTPSSGKVLIASNMSDVEQAAENIKRVTGR